MRPADDPNGVIAGLARHLFDSATDIPDAEQGRPIALPELARGDSATPGDLTGLFSAFARGRFESPEDIAAAGRAAISPIEKALKLAAEAEQKQWNSERAQSARLLLIIDQFDELFAGGVDDEARAGFARLIDRMLRTGLVWIVATLRSESFDAYLKSPLARLSAPAIGERADGASGAASSAAQLDLVFRLLPPSLSEISEVVRGPAAAAGLGWETDPETHQRLDERLIADIDRPDLLPLVQFVLGRLFEQREAKGDKVTLTYAAYRALGRLDGAIDHEAERAVCALGQPELAILPRLLRALVTYGSTAGSAGKSTPTLRPAYREAIAYDAPSARLVDALVQARILVSGLDIHDRQVVSLAHQRVIEAWARAKTIVAESEGVLRVRDEVEEAQRRWQDGGQRRDRLIPAGLPLSEAEHAAKTLGDELPAATRAFIDKSGRAARLRQRLTAAAAIVFLVVAGAAVLEERKAEKSATDAADQRDRAEQQTKLAEAQTQRAETAAQQASTSAEEANRERDRAEAQTKIALANEAEAKRQKESRDRQLLIANETYKLGILSYRRVAYRFGAEKNYDAALKELAGVETSLRGYTPQMPNDPWLPHEIASVKTQAGYFLNLKSEPQAALESFRQSREMLVELVKNNPSNVTFRKDLLEARTGIANDLVQLNRRQDALDELLAAKTAEAKLPADNSRNTELRYWVAVTDTGLGNEFLTAMRSEEAKGVFEEARKLSAELVAEDPKNEEWVNQLAVSNRGIANVLWAKNQFSDALPMYTDALNAFHMAASLNANNTDYVWGSINASFKIGQTSAALGKPDQSLSAYGDALAMLAAASQKWPDNNKNWSAAFIFAQETVGGFLESQNKPAEALAAYQQARDRQKELVSATPSDQSLRPSLVRIDDHVGDLLVKLDRLDDALVVLNEELDAAKSNLATNSVEGQDDLVIGYVKAAAILAHQMRYDEAIADYRQALGIRQAFLKTAPDHKMARAAEYDLLRLMGNAFAQEGKDDEALAAYRDSVDSGAKLIALDASDTANLHNVALTDTAIGGLLLKKSDNDGAAAAYQAALDLWERFVPQHPEDMAGRAALAWTYGSIGEVFRAQGKLIDASGALEKCLLLGKAALSDDAATARSWTWLPFFARDLGHLAYRLDLTKMFEKALGDADLALSIVPTETFIESNRAYALMFLGRIEEARAIYLAHRGEQVAGMLWEKLVLEDFEGLRKAGLSHPLMDEIQTTFAAKP
jgi:eukaryotic-like serine/threonine-protein kinase